eukprot:scaffold6899_cov183-Amphora_coffeaeformis.AAC.23
MFAHIYWYHWGRPSRCMAHSEICMSHERKGTPEQTEDNAFQHFQCTLHIIVAVLPSLLASGRLSTILDDSKRYCIS